MKITHVVPRLAPQIDGLGDYARRLGDHLFEESGIRSNYLVGDPSWAPGASCLQDPAASEVRAVSRQSTEDLLNALKDTETVMLHYVGYGYQTRGVPLWINHAIRKWRKTSSGRKLIVVFHELWASGPPWKSECYLGWLQQRLVRELFHLADVAVANAPHAWRRLEAISPRKTLFHPVPCNVSVHFGKARRWHCGGPVTLALFGMPAQRKRSLRKHANLVTMLDRAGLISRVSIVGNGASAGDRPSEDVRMLRGLVSHCDIHVLPDATPEEAGAALASADMLLSFYPSRWLFKSGSAMAALANGAVPVIPEGRHLEIVTEGKEVLVCSGNRRSVSAIFERVGSREGIASSEQSAQAWYYACADWPILARKLFVALKQSGRAPVPVNRPGRPGVGVPQGRGRIV